VSRTRKKRAYDSRSRQEAAQATRRAIIDNARRLFLARGYAGTTMPAIAKAAGVALDTVYATIGNKPTLFRLLVEAAISGRDEAVIAEERDYVRGIHAEPDPARKLRLYATALGAIHPRLAPIFQVLETAAPLDSDLKNLWREIAKRRAANMRILAEELAATGRLRAGLTVPVVADIIWSMNAPEFFLLLVEQRGWSSAQFAEWLGEAWVRLLLEG
jgi:AcrR family transcriptional regulator